MNHSLAVARLLRMAELAQGPRWTASPELLARAQDTLLWSTIHCCGEPDEARGHQVAEFLVPGPGGSTVMLNPTSGPLRPRVLLVDDELTKLDTALGRAAESLAKALEARNIEVVRALSFEDGQAIVSSDSSLRAVLLDWNLGRNNEGTHAQATALLHKLRERHAAVPVFLLADRERTRGTMTVEVAEMVDEFVWLLDDFGRLHRWPRDGGHPSL